MRTDIRRWWVINRLHHAPKEKVGNDWVEESHFMPWMTGQKMTQMMTNDYAKNFMIIPLSELCCRIMGHLFFAGGGYNNFWSDVRSVILECSSPIVGTIERQTPFVSFDLPKIKLTEKGKSEYAFSTFLVYFCEKYKMIGVTLWILFGATLLPYFWHFIKLYLGNS